MAIIAILYINIIISKEEKSEAWKRTPAGKSASVKVGHALSKVQDDCC